ncbi:choice-of-anchor D domain-containing protein [Acidisarcina polymorpha]|uniref:choice-of-anchor D domain-containing protein n=1 Tax=Acidisarcina polymorpha TaxID=2211140 RepID=UPI00137524E3|nr:choice-of-anchor D domain-containing protein [Acidisarcina polymorpha]
MVPASLAFGSISYGSTLSLPLPVTNAGSGSLTISPSIQGPSYKVLSSTPVGCLSATPSGATCTLTIEFAPVTIGPHDDSLTLTTNGNSSPIVLLNGTATGAGTEQESPLRFPSIPVGTSVFLPLPMNAVGVDTSTVDYTKSIDGASFKVAENSYNDAFCQGRVFLNGTCDLLIEFTPTAEGLHDGTLTFRPKNAAASKIKLTGSGGPSTAPQPIPKGNIFVYSEGDERVVTFNSEGVYQSQFTYLYRQPGGIAVDATSVYVKDGGGFYGSDNDPHCLLDKFDPRGFLVAQFGICTGEGPGAFDNSGVVAVDGDGNLWVTSPTYGYIQKLDSSGNFLKIICLGPTAAAAVPNCPAATKFDVVPYFIAFDAAGDIYVTNSNRDAGPSHRFLVKLDSTGKYLLSFGTVGSSPGRFNELLGPWGIAFNADGFLYVVDPGNNRVQVFSQDGIYQSQIGTGIAGWGPGQFYDPIALAFSSEGILYVTDQQNSRVEEISPAGTFLGRIGRLGSNPGELEGPYWIAIAK